MRRSRTARPASGKAHKDLMARLLSPDYASDLVSTGRDAETNNYKPLLKRAAQCRELKKRPGGGK